MIPRKLLLPILLAYCYFCCCLIPSSVCKGVVSPSRVTDPDPVQQKKDVPHTTEHDDSEVIVLDEVAVRVLRNDPSQPQPQKNNVHPQLIVRWNAWINKGLEKDNLSKLMELYEPISQLNAHKINPELAHTLSDKVKKRDSYFCNTQKIAGAALTTLGLATSSLLQNCKEINREFLLEKLHDAGKLISYLHHGQFVGRRACIIPFAEKNLRQLVNDLNPNEFLFGENLSDNIKKFIGDGRNNFILEYFPKKDFVKNFNLNRPPVKQNYTNQVGSRKFLNYKKNVVNSRHSKSLFQNMNNRNPSYSQKRWKET